MAEHAGSPTWRPAQHFARHDPARVLREVEAKRKRLAEYEAVLEEIDPDEPDDRVLRSTAYAMIRYDAEVYSDHPDYDTAWTVALDN